jgi:5-hydroxyisourate hydrolase-like protein (transthyretin family)
VFDAQGQPATDVLMELVPADGQDNGFATFVTTDKEGRYEMKLVRPGRYLFGVRIYGSAGSTYMPFPRTYYPGVREADRAAIITVVEGQRIDLNDLILPPRFVERVLNGIVVDTDGRPVSGATVWLKENEYQDRDMPYRKETDSDGRFSFRVFEGINYDLKAYLDSDKGERKQAEHSIRITSDAEIIRLILK